jgi:hypothetical protein
MSGILPAKELPFECKKIPLRHWSFPPAIRALPASYKFKSWFRAVLVARKEHITKTDVIIVKMHTGEHILARQIASITGAKLIVLVQDKWREPPESEYIKTLKTAVKVFCVSKGLKRLIFDIAGVCADILFPIGEERLEADSVSNNRDSNHLLLGIAGGLDREYVSFATSFGFSVCAICDKVHEFTNVHFRPRFEKNIDALCFLKESCDILLVLQRPDQGDYLTYSFPSRFIDFAQTSLPIIVCAPENSNLGEYARQIGWSLFMNGMEDTYGRQKIVEKLSTVSGRYQASLETIQLASTDFNPNKIYQKLFDAIKQL